MSILSHYDLIYTGTQVNAGTDKICKVNKCTNTVQCRSLCSKHYYDMAIYNAIRIPCVMPVYCNVVNCSSYHYAKGYCRLHYGGDRRKNHVPIPRAATGRVCKITDCKRVTKALGLCMRHYQSSRMKNINKKELS